MTTVAEAKAAATEELSSQEPEIEDWLELDFLLGKEEPFAPAAAEYSEVRRTVLGKTWTWALRDEVKEWLV